jgi:hypothetical protein
MEHTQLPGSAPVELSDKELAAVHGGLFGWVKKLIHAITHRNEPEPGQPFGSDPTYHPPVQDYVPPHRWV